MIESSIPLAYSFVAISLMLGEVDYCAEKLQLPLDRPVSNEALKLCHVSSPYVTGFGGTFDTERYSFTFFKSGKLYRIQRINRFEKIPLRDLHLKLSQMKSLINTNDAYEMATNWLSAISVDVPALEKKYPCLVTQRFFYPDAVDLNDSPERRKRVVALPIFHAKWGDVENPAVMVSIFGPTKELLGIYQNDHSFSRRPEHLLKDVSALLAIGDDEFKKYNEDQRKELVAKFSAVEHGKGFVLPTNLLFTTGSPRSPAPSAFQERRPTARRLE